MCTICNKVIPDFGVKHTESLCPVGNSRYCSNCAKYGHITKRCPAKPTFQEPTYLEQLIPPSELKEFNITSKTLIKCKAEEPPQLIEIKDDDKVIMSYLSARSIRIKKGFTKRNTIEEYAKLNNKRLVYIG